MLAALSELLVLKMLSVCTLKPVPRLKQKICAKLSRARSAVTEVVRSSHSKGDYQIVWQ